MPHQQSTSSFKSVISVMKMLTVAFVASSLALVVIYSFVPVPVTPLMALRSIEAGWSGHGSRFEKRWIEFDELPPTLIRAAIASEDFRFMEHNGFDFEAIQKALESNQRAARLGRKKFRGASTISQQTAKNVFLWPNRSWLRKGLEAWFTILIERVWTKRRVLEVYLNVIEFGDGVYGVEAASRRYFRKSARELTPGESALLIAVLPNPRRFRVDRTSPFVRYRQSAILRRLAYVEGPE